MIPLTTYYFFPPRLLSSILFFTAQIPLRVPNGEFLFFLLSDDDDDKGFYRHVAYRESLLTLVWVVAGIQVSTVGMYC